MSLFVSSEGLSTGDEIGIYARDFCIGSGVVGNASFIEIPVSSDDPLTGEIDGFIEGDEIQYRLWDRDSQEELSEIEVEFIFGDGRFSDLGTSFVKIDNTILIPDESYIKPSYPNPFIVSTTIEFGLKEQGHVEVEIYNIKGQKVKTLLNDTLDANNYSVTWDGKDELGYEVANGMYLYKIHLNNSVSIKKIMKMN